MNESKDINAASASSSTTWEQKQQLQKMRNKQQLYQQEQQQDDNIVQPQHYNQSIYNSYTNNHHHKNNTNNNHSQSPPPPPPYQSSNKSKLSISNHNNRHNRRLSNNNGSTVSSTTKIQYTISSGAPISCASFSSSLGLQRSIFSNLPSSSLGGGSLGGGVGGGGVSSVNSYGSSAAGTYGGMVGGGQRGGSPLWGVGSVDTDAVATTGVRGGGHGRVSPLKESGRKYSDENSGFKEGGGTLNLDFHLKASTHNRQSQLDQQKGEGDGEENDEEEHDEYSNSNKSPSPSYFNRNNYSRHNRTSSSSKSWSSMYANANSPLVLSSSNLLNVISKEDGIASKSVVTNNKDRITENNNHSNSNSNQNEDRTAISSNWFNEIRSPEHQPSQSQISFGHALSSSPPALHNINSVTSENYGNGGSSSIGGISGLYSGRKMAKTLHGFTYIPPLHHRSPTSFTGINTNTHTRTSSSRRNVGVGLGFGRRRMIRDEDMNAMKSPLRSKKYDPSTSPSTSSLLKESEVLPKKMNSLNKPHLRLTKETRRLGGFNDNLRSFETQRNGAYSSPISSSSSSSSCSSLKSKSKTVSKSPSSTSTSTSSIKVLDLSSRFNSSPEISIPKKLSSSSISKTRPRSWMDGWSHSPKFNFDTDDDDITTAGNVDAPSSPHRANHEYEDANNNNNNNNNTTNTINICKQGESFAMDLLATAFQSQARTRPLDLFRDASGCGERKREQRKNRIDFKKSISKSKISLSPSHSCDSDINGKINEVLESISTSVPLSVSTARSLDCIMPRNEEHGGTSGGSGGSGNDYKKRGSIRPYPGTLPVSPPNVGRTNITMPVVPFLPPCPPSPSSSSKNPSSPVPHTTTTIPNTNTSNDHQCKQQQQQQQQQQLEPIQTWDNCLFVRSDGAVSGRLHLTKTHLVFAYDDDDDDDDENVSGGNGGNGGNSNSNNGDYSHNGDGVTHVNVPRDESGEGGEVEVVKNASRNRNGNQGNHSPRFDPSLDMNLYEYGFSGKNYAEKSSITTSSSSLEGDSRGDGEKHDTLGLINGVTRRDATINGISQKNEAQTTTAKMNETVSISVSSSSSSTSSELRERPDSRGMVGTGSSAMESNYDEIMDKSIIQAIKEEARKKLEELEDDENMIRLCTQNDNHNHEVSSLWDHHNHDHSPETTLYNDTNEMIDGSEMHQNCERMMYITGEDDRTKQKYLGIKWPLSELGEVYPRNYIMREVALEIYGPSPVQSSSSDPLCLTPTVLSTKNGDAYTDDELDIPLTPLSTSSLFLAIPDAEGDDEPENGSSRFGRRKKSKLLRRDTFVEALKDTVFNLDLSFWGVVTGQFNNSQGSRGSRSRSGSLDDGSSDSSNDGKKRTPWKASSLFRRRGKSNPLQLLTRAWRRGDISNYDYLLRLNAIAGRSFHDPGNYPVMPWVLSNYHSSTVPDLSDHRNYRDLTKPMGAQCKDRLQRFVARYQDFCACKDTDGSPFLYGSHYSNTGGVILHYLVRTRPFAGLHRQLQVSLPKSFLLHDLYNFRWYNGSFCSPVASILSPT